MEGVQASQCVIDISLAQLSRLIPYRHPIVWRPDGGGCTYLILLVSPEKVPEPTDEIVKSRFLLLLDI